jgi:multisubunit Na+/H+ antiporter MnhB subunit
MSKKLLVGVLIILFGVLVRAVIDMPTIGSADHPAYNDSTQYYIENAVSDTNSPNVITAIITDYRAFDTLGETTVLFTSIAAVASVLMISHHKEDNHE